MNLEGLKQIADVPSLLATIEGATHPDYKRVTELADLYHKLISGDGIETLLKRFVRREDDAMFKQRVEMTQAITPSLSSQLMAPFYKVTRVNDIKALIDFAQTEGFQNKKENVLRAIKEYNGDNTLDDFMDTRFIELSFTDPNSFIVTDFYDGPRDANGNPIGPAVPYPIEVSSHQAVNYKYVNNTLKWLIVDFGGRYVMYMSVYAVGCVQINQELYQQVPKGTAATVFDPERGEIVVYRTQGEKLWMIEVFDHKSEKVPAKRVGYKRDLVTKGRTCVNPLHDALPYFMKSIKTVSEFDLTMALHAHPQKLQQSPRCVKCDKGTDPEGKPCGSCGGSGTMPISTTAQDAIVVPLAKNKEDILELDNLVKYVELPVDLLKFQNEHIKELKQEALQAMYNSDVFSRTTVVATATEKKQSMESVYDVLMPFSKQYSAMWKYNVTICAQYVDATGAIIEHTFPKDFGFRTRDELIAQLSASAESNAPSYIKRAISHEIGESLFVDNPEEMRKIEIKEMLFPFADKNQAELALILNSDMTTEYNKVLWANYDQIFDSLEAEAEEKGLYLYDMAPKAIRDMVKVKVESLILMIKESTPAPIMQVDIPSVGADPNNSDDNIDGDNPTS